MRRIRQLKLEVRSACQYDCEMCAHGEQRRTLRNYELTLEELSCFLNATRDSGYFVENVRIHGPGEPLLWKHFNQGIAMLRSSGVVGSIFVATNGLMLHRISEEAWSCLDEMRVSVYADFNKHQMLSEMMARFPTKIKIHSQDGFFALPLPGSEAPIPCVCGCDGPMLLGSRVFLYCGPPVFAAARAFERDALTDASLFVDVGPNYMESWDEKRLGNMEYCKRCWANGNRVAEVVPQRTTGGNWK